MSSESKQTHKGWGIGTFIFLIFLVLKLAEIGVVAKWSWWWVTSPMWIPAILVIGGLALAGFYYFIKALLK